MENNNTVKTIIVDDDPDFSDILSIYLRKIGIQKIAVAEDFVSGKKLIDSEEPDLALLDVDLGCKQTGIDLGIYIRENYPKTRIIYFTNNFTEQIFLSAKQVHPNAFLDKQLDDLKVRQAIELALLQESQEPVALKVGIPACYFAKEFIFVKIGNVFKKVELKDIEYIFYADRYANLQLDGKVYPLNMTMKELAQNLPDSIFVQIHQSFIVNLSKITQISTVDNQVEVSGKWLPLGVSFRKDFRDKLFFLT